ncbi:MAG: hypothetical protein K6A44_07825 [bacterium]|nr:hypothetical protein [bacterium]
MNENKRFHKVNLPFLISICILVFTLFIIMFCGANIYLMLVTIFMIGISLICVFVACPIGLVFQILNKEKTKTDKIFILLNCLLLIFVGILIILGIIAFPNIFVKEETIREQVKNEYQVLNKEYQPVLKYLDAYKKENGVYPQKIDEKIIPKSNTFNKYVYHTVLNKTGYWLEVYPTNGPIEYYYTDKNDKGYTFYKGDGTIDSAFENFNYYEVDKNWHAVEYQLQTRHSIFFDGNSYDRMADIDLKDNIGKYSFNSKKK